MICPRCGNEWDASKSPCTRCGLVVRLPGGSTGRSSLPTQRGHGQPGTLPPIKQQSGRMSPTLASNISRPAT